MLDENEFRQWLLDNPEIRFFDRGYSNSCPIAKFVQHKTGAHTVSVSLDDYTTYEADDSFRQYIKENGLLPEWAKELILVTVGRDRSPQAILRNLEGLRHDTN